MFSEYHKSKYLIMNTDILKCKSKVFACFMLLMILLCLFSFNVNAKECPFSRGVNITGWFQANSAKEIHFLTYTKTDFEQIKSLGCDVVRLPVNLHFMTSGAPDYELDPIFLAYLDQVVNWCNELSLHLIIDNHTFDVDSDTDPNIGQVIEKVWTQLALHYINASEKVYFEVLNEPHGISDVMWNSIQQEVVKAIRAVNTKHTIIVGPAGWNSYNNLNAMPIYADDNLIYTFHFYDPFLFTHQGASWSDLDPVQGIPFPYTENRMPQCPDELKGTWMEGGYSNYKNEGNMQEVKKLIDIAVGFAQKRNVAIYCGEFGVYDLYSNPDDRVFWYQEVRKYLEEKNIAWTIWDYHGGFGLFNKGGNNIFEHDLNIPLVEALGFNAPAQTPYVIRPDSVGIVLYSDMIAKGVKNSSYGDGNLNLFSVNYPNSGEYCIAWEGASQYQAIVFDFSPNKDLSYLLENDYGLSFLIRGNQPAAKYDVRFVDTKTDELDDRPWRMRTTIDAQMVSWDNQWHKVFVPLSDFVEGGAWDEIWYNPDGKFDWTVVDKLEFVSEHGPLGEYQLFIDDIAITNLDTAQVRVVVSAFCNPVNIPFASIKHQSLSRSIRVSVTSDKKISYHLFDIMGRTYSIGSFEGQVSISTKQLLSGMYLLTLHDGHQQFETRKIWIE